jgi:serine phosphatase RsbU (regulator of sigma subunit)
LESGDCIYLFSDGFVDQFGGERGKKFMRKRFKEMLLQHSALSMDQQMIAFKTTLRQWQGEQEQVDDILLMGIRI